MADEKAYDVAYWKRFRFETVTPELTEHWIATLTDDECEALAVGFFYQHDETGRTMELMREVGNTLSQMAITNAYLHAQIDHGLLLLIRKGVRAHVQRQRQTKEEAR